MIRWDREFTKLLDLNKHLSIVHIILKRQFIYKTHLLFSLINSLLPIIATYYLWSSVYQDTPKQLSVYYDYPAILVYIISVFVLYNLVTPFGLEWEISSLILEGKISKIILYPYGFIAYWVSWLAGEKIFALLIRIPIFTLVIFFLKDKICMLSIADFILFSISLLFSCAIFFHISFIVGLSAFWWTDVTGVFYLVQLLVSLLSGLLIPLDVFPAVWRKNLTYTPFYYLLYFPVQIFMQRLPIESIQAGLCWQILWIFIMHLISKVVLYFGLKKNEADGG